ncbi:hypothetical protein OG194_43675 [Streptomyces sp. NBC_01288]|uniref:hypothetical protein n=1 Tax=Streptomyces sp. NBC_01288 TaxID=2903814 RepID=UPI002E0F40D0|nr:hypothetical protein OG194_43675 [Streptomyces sp. NBC_01288]
MPRATSETAAILLFADLTEAAVQPCPGVLDALRAQLSDLDHRAAELAAARAVLRDTIAGAETRTASAPAPASAPE